MKCPGCEYELWNLKAGPCPECGRPFKPSEFDFLANAVKFCCPHCSQAYYGTGEKGELEPSEFDCVSCGGHVTIDDMLLLPADALGKREPTRSTNPWLDPHRKRRWFGAIAAGIGQPGRMLEATPVFGTTGKAVVFASLNFFMAGLLGIVMGVLLMIASGGSGVGVLAFMLISGVLVPALYMFLWAAVTHGVLKLFRQSTPDGMGRTLQAIAFTSGAWMFALIPCMGWFLGFVAWTACAPAAVRAAHKCRLGSAIVATLVLPVITAATGIGLYAWMIFGTMGGLGTTSSYYSPVPPPGWAQGTGLDPDVVALVDELRYGVNYGSPPLHGAGLMDPAMGITHRAFSEPSTPDVTIGSHTASTLEAMRPRDREAALAAITSSWPADVTAHRVGRLIFTHHGIKPGDDPGLTLLIVMPATPGGDWHSIHMTGWQSSSMLPMYRIGMENTSRVAAGLPPLPDLNTMTSGTGPWTAADGVPPPPPPP
ncbi:MAG: hypothetical protein NCW75_10100 [Phycisphaera sp.]|nr:MAG: hypothetical protein NCW75_10100 [Phycisphaera sp.]